MSGLLVLSLVGLTSCGGNNGLVKGGQAYRDGQLDSVNEEVKTNVDGKVKIVNEKVTSDISMKMTFEGQTESMSAKINGNLKIDLDAAKIDGNYSISSKAGGENETMKLDFTAQQQEDGSFTFTSGNEELVEQFQQIDLAVAFEQAETTIYAWNYSMDSESIMSLVGSGLSGSEMSEQDLEQALVLVESLSKSLFISGDVEKGSFEIGLAEAAKLNIGGMPFEFNKLKSVYKDGLLRSTIAGYSMNLSGDTMKISASATSTAEYTYEMR